MAELGLLCPWYSRSGSQLLPWRGDWGLGFGWVRSHFLYGNYISVTVNLFGGPAGTNKSESRIETTYKYKLYISRRNENKPVANSGTKFTMLENMKLREFLVYHKLHVSGNLSPTAVRIFFENQRGVWLVGEGNPLRMKKNTKLPLTFYDYHPWMWITEKIWPNYYIIPKPELYKAFLGEFRYISPPFGMTSAEIVITCPTVLSNQIHQWQTPPSEPDLPN